MKTLIYLYFVAAGSLAFANPYWDQSRVPLDSSYKFNKSTSEFSVTKLKSRNLKKGSLGLSSVRITLDWNEKTDRYLITEKVLENSGTEALLLRAKRISPFGSFKAKVSNIANPLEIYYDSIGTGQVYKRIARSITFRFPVPKDDFTFEIETENSIKGNMETVFTETIKLRDLGGHLADLKDLEIVHLKSATKSPSLKVAIYAEGYQLANKDHFFQSAMRVVDVLKNYRLPGFESMDFTAVYATSNLALGAAKDLGLPVKPRDSAFGMYYPYWYNFGRWFNVVYPTDENKFRAASAVVPYDYNIVLVDSSEYWGVGNFRAHTTIPTKGSNFIFLLLHEMGHYFGLNEEYDGGGRTELEFAPEIEESWSQNMTFLPEPKIEKIKWASSVVDQSTPIPTPKSFWKLGKLGAYAGGYGDSTNVYSESYKPGFACVMDRGENFCDVCTKGILEVIDFDLGK